MKACTFGVVACRTDDYRIGMVSNTYWVYRIKLYRLVLYRGKPDIMCITAGSVAVNGSHYTKRLKGVNAPSRGAAAK